MKPVEGSITFSSGIDTINESDIDDEIFLGNEPSIVLERRRRSHTAAEQRRRNAIKKGYEELRELVYPKNSGSSSTNRISKTCILNKTVSEIEKHNKELEQKQTDIERLEKSVTTLRILNSFYEERAKGTIPQNAPAEPVSDELKFHIFKLFSDSLFASFDSRVSLAPFSEFADCILRWLEDTCDQRFLSKLMDSVVSSTLPVTGDQGVLPRAMSGNFCPDPSDLSANQGPTRFLTNSPDNVPFKDSPPSGEWIQSDAVSNNAAIPIMPDTDYPVKQTPLSSATYEQHQPFTNNPDIVPNTSGFVSTHDHPPTTTPTKFNGYKRNSLPHDLTVVLRTQASKPVESVASSSKRDFDFPVPHLTLAAASRGPSFMGQIRSSGTFAPKFQTLVSTQPSGSTAKPSSFGLTTSAAQYKPFF
ncbi:hypothetical protein CRM22_005593 [Opisthorchis felineus]|uniref:BHLH domain-containing protein n=1 Tax=Opisthorchis felineus TaxID=147828 RepID=A0A4S2LQH5_OPIFE|nr:hypothetical protein CRM22_005593 [Opisthorchis felineus]